MCRDDMDHYRLCPRVHIPMELNMLTWAGHANDTIEEGRAKGE